MFSRIEILFKFHTSPYFSSADFFSPNWSNIILYLHFHVDVLFQVKVQHTMASSVFSWKTSNLDGIGYWKFNIHWSSRDDCWVSTAYILNFDMTNLSSRCLSWKMSHSLPRMRVSSFLVLERIHMYFTFQMQLFWTISDGIPELDFFYHPISNNIVSIHLKPHHKDKIDFH